MVDQGTRRQCRGKMCSGCRDRRQSAARGRQAAGNQTLPNEADVASGWVGVTVAGSGTAVDGRVAVGVDVVDGESVGVSGTSTPSGTAE